MKVIELQHDAVMLLTDTEELIRQLLEDDQVLVYPTDTLYGLGVDAKSKAAVAKLYHLKLRENAPVSVLLESTDQLLSMAENLSNKAGKLIKQFLPGPMTVICHSQYHFAPQLVSSRGTVGFRVPGDFISRRIAQLRGSPITTTSVNPTGATPATSLDEVSGYFKNQVALMLDIGPLKLSKGSTVIDLTTRPFKILREGEITRQALREFLN